MDALSTLTGFVVGAFTGAAGTYLGNKYTDKRREQQRIKERVERWKDIERKFPSLISEMREDLSKPGCKDYRAFFVVTNLTIITGSPEPSFAYHIKDHTNLQAAVEHLQRSGYICKIPTGTRSDHYRIHERLVDALHGKHV